MVNACRALGWLSHDESSSTISSRPMKVFSREIGTSLLDGSCLTEQDCSQEFVADSVFQGSIFFLLALAVLLLVDLLSVMPRAACSLATLGKVAIIGSQGAAGSESDSADSRQLLQQQKFLAGQSLDWKKLAGHWALPWALPQPNRASDNR